MSFGAPRSRPSEMVICEKWWGVSNGVFLYHASTQAVRRVAHDPSNPGFWVVNYVCPLRGHLEQPLLWVTGRLLRPFHYCVYNYSTGCLASSVGHILDLLTVHRSGPREPEGCLTGTGQTQPLVPFSRTHIPPTSRVGCSPLVRAGSS